MYKQQIFKKNETNSREYFIDFLKTLAIIFVIIDNAAICWTEECNFAPTNLKLLYGECFWNGQGVPIFLFVSGWLFAKWIERKKIRSISECYSISTLIQKYLRFIIPIAFAFIVKMILLGCINGWGLNVLTGLYSGCGAYYISIVLEMIVICPLIYYLIKKLDIWGLAICFVIATGYDLICWGFNVTDWVYKQIIIRFVFMIGAGIYTNKRILENRKYQWYFALPSFVIGLTLLILTYYFDLPMHVNAHWYQDCTLSNLYAIPILALLVRTFKMKNQKWWAMIGRSTFNIYLCQNILFTFPKQIVVANIFSLQLLFNEAVSISAGWPFWFGEHRLTGFLCTQIDKMSHKHQ